MTALKRFFLWLLGELPTFPSDPDGARRLVWVFSVAATAIWLDTRHTFSQPHAEDTWTFAIYGAMPLCAALLWELRDRAQSALLAGVALALVVAPLAARVLSETWSARLAEDPTPLLAASFAAVGLVALEFWRHGLSLDRWGLALGDWRWWGPRFAFALGAVQLLVLGAAWASPEMRAYYPEYGPAKTDASELIRYQAWLGLYMLGWEAFFRGFLVNGLARRGDSLYALFAAAMPFFLLHWHKPEAEMLSSFVGGIGAGWFALRARSFLPVWGLHWAMNGSMELTCFVWRRLEGS